MLAAAAVGRTGDSGGSTLIGAVIAGAFTLLGAWLSRWLRRTGTVRCSATATDSLILGIGGDFLVPLEVDKPGPPVSNEALEWVTHGIVYTLSLQFFNERDVNTGLRDLSVIFLDARGTMVQKSPLRKKTEALTGNTNGEELGDPLLLRSGEFVVLTCETTLATDPDNGTTQIQRCWSAELRGAFPDGSALRQSIEFPHSSNESEQRVG